MLTAGKSYAAFVRLVRWRSVLVRFLFLSTLLGASCLDVTSYVFAQTTTPNSAAKKHEWLAKPPREEAQARITNLSNGDRVESPFVVKFGMSHWGIAPADHDHAMTGHHHLLIDAPLPIPLDAPIAFSDNYRHFGKGQMETVLNLPPGKHTLQLLLANHKHVPFFVYSNAVTVTVSQKNLNALPADYGKKPRLEILSPKDGEERNELLQIVFHASGLNVAHEATKLVDSGYFRLAIAHERKAGVELIAFPAGQTETWLKLPKGKAKFQLEFIKNPNNEVHEVKSEWTKIIVR